MPVTEADQPLAELDLSDVAPRVGVPVGGGEMWEPCSASDIRRWVMALDYPNPIHWDQPLARASRFGGLVAPQSFAVAMDYGHGVHPSVVGYIADSHQLFGGEEWWFYGPHIRPGDALTPERRFHDYAVRQTRFAGPTMFSRGDTLHRNQHGEPVAKHRTTSIRYLSSEAAKRLAPDRMHAPKPVWNDEELKAIARVRHAWILSNRDGATPRVEEVKVGDQLPRRAIGPHSIATFTTEFRAFLFNIWGTYHFVSVPGVEDCWVNQDAGWGKGFELDDEAARVDPRYRDGLYMGPARGHIDSAKAIEVGMPRAYGFGSIMGSWMLDYLGYWAGHQGFLRHTQSTFRLPYLEGDVTYVDGEVIAVEPESAWGAPLVKVRVQMTNQDGQTILEGVGDVEILP
jgi:acyl dehydratase